jgi:dihydropyrimidine dehydrogenase (NADP+)
MTAVLMPCDSDRPLETMLDEFKRLKDEYPDRILIASIMEVRASAQKRHAIDTCYS